MSVAGHTPPPFFRRGPAPLAQLTVFVLVALALIVADVRFDALQQVRRAAGVVLSPVQQALAFPASATQRLAEYFTLLSTALTQMRDLQREQAEAAPRLLREGHLEDENRRLRALLDLRERLPVTGRVAEVLYAARDPFSRHVIIDKGSQHGIGEGNAVIDAGGVVGQVVRVFPLTAEVALLTDSNHAIPVQVERNGLRAVLFGAGAGRLELRYLAANADVVPGDRIITSGLDNVYLSGLPVASVLGRDNDSAHAFARVLCEPLAGVETQGMVMVLPPPPDKPASPEGFEAPRARTAEPSPRESMGKRGVRP